MGRRDTLLAVALALLVILLVAIFIPRDEPVDPPPPPVPDEADLPALEPPPVRFAPPAPPPAPRGLLPTPTDSLLPKSDRKPRTWLTGLLTGPDGEPLSGVIVRLEPDLIRRVVVEKNPHTGVPRRILLVTAPGDRMTVEHCGGHVRARSLVVGKTDDQGRFTIPRPAANGWYRVDFAPAGSKRASHDTLLRTDSYRCFEEVEGTLGVLRVPRSATITGEVLDHDGKPVFGARVSYWPDGFGIRSEDLLPAGEAPVTITRFNSVGMSSGYLGMGATDTDREGRFTITGVIPGTHTVLVSAPGHSGSHSQADVVVNEGDAVRGIRFTVERIEPPVLGGRVLDARTDKTVRAHLKITRGDGGNRLAGLRYCRPDGTFEIGSLVPDVYFIRATAKGYESVTSGPHRIGSGDRKTGIEIRLPPAD